MFQFVDRWEPIGTTGEGAGHRGRCPAALDPPQEDRSMHRPLVAAAAALAMALAIVAGPTASGAAPAYAPAATATIHPGVQTFTAGGQCTANFVYTDGTNTYIGQA